MNKLLILSVMALMMPIAPALACFPEDDETKEVLFAAGLRGRTPDDTAFQFGRDPLPMSFCEKDEPGFVVVNGKCYDFDAITDFETEEDCQADEVCKAYREQQEGEQEHFKCPAGATGEGPDCTELKSLEEQEYEQNQDRTDDPNHGEIKGDEELVQDQEQDEEEHQEEEEQGQEESEQTTQETAE